MKTILLSIGMLFCLETLPSYGQGNRFAMGVVTSFDTYLSQSRPNPTLLRTDYFSSVGYGIDLSYKSGFWLFNARFLTSERKYDQLYDIRVVNPDDIVITTKARNTGRYYSIPLTVSYQLNRSHKLQVFGGMGIVTEWVGRQIRVETYKALGGPTSVPSYETEPNALVGGSLQVVLRYHLTNRFLLQLEPALRYFPQDQSTFYGKPGATANVLLSVGYKL